MRDVGGGESAALHLFSCDCLLLETCSCGSGVKFGLLIDSTPAPCCVLPCFVVVDFRNKMDCTEEGNKGFKDTMGIKGFPSFRVGRENNNNSGVNNVGIGRRRIACLSRVRHTCEFFA